MNNLLLLTSTAVQNDAFLQTLNTAVTALIVLLVLVVLMAVLLELMHARTRQAPQRRFFRLLSIPVYFVAVLVLGLAILCGNRINQLNPQVQNPTGDPQGTTISATPTGSDPSESTPAPTTPTTPPTEPTPSFSKAPHKTSKTNPSNWGVKWEIIANGKTVKSYQRPTSIHMGLDSEYFALPGISGFRGGNYRTGATYGTVNVQNKTLQAVWQRDISSLPKAKSGSWTGAGWTGQPLVVQWDEQTKANMNLYPDKKAKKDLVEVIYATLDGHVYFYDLHTGEYTRDPLNVGMAFKGSGALDPRGYPILYVGSGDRTRESKEPRMYIINLLNTSIMYQYGHEKEFNYRNWRAFDSSPLVDAETDTLIWPGENGLIYTIKLNTKYDKSAGKLSIKPDKPVLNRYMTDLNEDNYSNNLGFENSAVLVENYLYVGDNRGMYFCVDINTMKLVWTQEIKDDLNATAVFEWGEDNQGYLYLATSTEYSKNTSYIYKLSATTGEIIWERSYGGVAYNKDVSGGALSSPLLGKKGTELEGMIFFHIAKTPSEYRGITVALDTKTGEVLWEKEGSYCWSSPVAVYSEDGKAYVVLFNSVGTGFLLDGKTGQEVTTVSVKTSDYTNVEASPVVFNDMIVVGTRSQKVFGIKIS